MTLLAETEDDSKGGRRPFFKFYFEDFVSGCMKAGLTLEEIGMYVLTLGFIWTDGGQTLADTSRLGIRSGVGTKIARRVLAQLIAKGKIQEVEGYLVNARMEREIVAYVAVKKAAKEREERRRVAKSTQVQVGFKSDLTGTQNQLNSEKANENNEIQSTEGPHTRSQTLDSKKEEKKERKKVAPQAPLETPPEGVAEEAPEDITARAAFDAYNALAERIGLTRAKLFTDGRRKAIRARIKEGGPMGWSRALAAIERSSFLRGKNDRKWKADLEFMIQPSSFAKMIDGRYGNGAAHIPDPGTAPASTLPHPEALPGETFAQCMQRLSRGQLDRYNDHLRADGHLPLERKPDLPNDDPF